MAGLWSPHHCQSLDVAILGRRCWARQLSAAEANPKGANRWDTKPFFEEASAWHLSGLLTTGDFHVFWVLLALLPTIHKRQHRCSNLSQRSHLCSPKFWAISSPPSMKEDAFFRKERPVTPSGEDSVWQWLRRHPIPTVGTLENYLTSLSLDSLISKLKSIIIVIPTPQVLFEDQMT